MLILSEKVAELADKFGKTKPQKEAITLAMQSVDDTMIVEKPSTAAMWAPTAESVVVVLSGQGIDNSHRQEVQRYLQFLRDRHGSIAVVTAGRRGVEDAAEKWADARGQQRASFAPVWQLPQPDGSTKYNGQARARRTSKLERIVRNAVAASIPTYVIVWGSEADDDTIEPRLIAAGAKPRTSSKYYVAPVDTSDLPAPVADTQTDSTPEPNGRVEVDVAAAPAQL